MRLKENTENSSSHIRTIAGLVLGVGIAIAILLVLVGFLIGFTSQSSGYGFIADWVESGAIGLLLGALLVLLYSYVAYVMISAYATIIENSDRTDVVQALWAINETLRKNPTANNTKTQQAVQKVTESMTKQPPIDLNEF